MIKFVNTPTPEPGIKNIVSEICSSLETGKPVLWLIPGGSNIPISVEIMKAVRGRITADQMTRLTITLTDERYGEVGHAHSNWRQLTDAGFPFEGIRSIQVLGRLSLDKAVKYYGDNIKAAIDAVHASGGIVIGQFGMGADGHVAGILPHSPATADFSKDDSDAVMAYAYEAEPLTRITLSFYAIRMFDSAHLFAFGNLKRQAILDLRDKDIPLKEQPVQVLKDIAKTFVYSDQL